MFLAFLFVIIMLMNSLKEVIFMNKQKLVVIGGILLIGISSVVVLNMDTGISSSIDRRTNREKQRDYLKERETEILQKIQK